MLRKFKITNNHLGIIKSHFHFFCFLLLELKSSNENICLNYCIFLFSEFISSQTGFTMKSKLLKMQLFNPYKVLRNKYMPQISQISQMVIISTRSNFK